MRGDPSAIVPGAAGDCRSREEARGAITSGFETDANNRIGMAPQLRTEVV